ncbi:hypothetical protein, variant [Fonticula alba]|uniref:UDP-N-acetylglucosamine diphosphorylase n=1 Tax=Fonticula alba TaxID=691883 RepID=A0A058ZBC4_FONAL|nr:hypothetical protein, variant [Fonticula alba]KCV71725.1 hypothetical protein, variant [Fonticula alba]|eukprot:XP_009493302.1 hypothetical protein, variant [Fonticula alba]
MCGPRSRSPYHVAALLTLPLMCRGLSVGVFPPPPAIHALGQAIPYGDLARGFAGLPWAELATQPDATLASVLTAPPADDGHPFYRQGAGADEQPTAPSPLPPGLVVDWTHVSDVELARAMDGQSDGGEARAAVAADTFADIASLEAMALSARDEGHTSTGQAASDGRRQCSARDLAGLTRLGSAEIASGRVAVVLLAGGQGTRLGHRGPKGTFSPAGLPSGKCIFRRHAERLLAASNRAQVVAQSAAQPSGPLSRHCRWVVLTSAETHHDTEAYFEAEDFFGLDRALVRFLTQASLPAVHLLDGTFILAEPYRLSTAPNGNGGLYEALARSGTLDWLEAGGVRHLQICGVDNLLTRAPCPGLVGMALAGGLRVASKAVPRVRPTEAVGVFAERHGRFGVVEYTELGADLAGAVADPATGRLAFDLANIGHQYMRLDVVRHLARLGAFHMLPFHKAQKRIAGLARAEAAGHRAASLCGLKLELFIFDTLPLVGTVTAGRAGVQLVRREAEFAPVKNADGPGAVDCPATAAGLLLDQCTAWLRDSGVQVDGSLRAEVAPRVSVAGEGLGAFAGLRLSVEPGRDAVFIDSREGLASLLQ